MNPVARFIAEVPYLGDQRRESCDTLPGLFVSVLLGSIKKKKKSPIILN